MDTKRKKAYQKKSKKRVDKRRRKKYKTLSYLQPLYEKGIAEKSPVNYSAVKSCSSCIRQEDGKLKSTYCDKRFCIVCNNIRKAKYIDRFKPVIKKDTERGHTYHHITLTFRTRSNNDLQKDYNALFHTAYKKLKRQLNRTHLKKDRFSEDKFTGIAKAEIEYRDDEKWENKYHPHLHMLVRGSNDLARFIQKLWVQIVNKYTHTDASYKAQKSTYVYNYEALKEVLKYVHKFTGNHPPEVIDNIFRTVKGDRMVRTFGDFYNVSDEYENVDEEVDDEDPEAVIHAFRRPEEDIIWTWDPSQGDWVDRQTGSYLHGGEPLTSKDKFPKAPSPDTRGSPPAAPPSGEAGDERPVGPDASKRDELFKAKVGREWERFKKNR